MLPGCAHDRANRYGVYFIFKSMEQGSTFRITVRSISPRRTTASWRTSAAASRIITSTSATKCSGDGDPSSLVLSVPDHLLPQWPQLHRTGTHRAQIGFRKNDNAFLAVDDVAALQAAADRLSADIIRQRLDYWTFLLGRNSPPGSARRSTSPASMPSRRSSTAATSSSSATFDPQAVRAQLRTRPVAAHSDKMAAIFGTRLSRGTAKSLPL